MLKTTGFRVEGAPEGELGRSPASAVVGLLAEQSHLLLAHYEYRINLDPPAHWLPLNRPDLEEPTHWINGVLKESKYQSFRNDLMLGSFHPGHRGKWTAHELCHGLVGFAWRPGASKYFHALAARLSELLPVALYYFFDEAYLRRCNQHERGGPLFGTYCPSCEALALKGPRKEDQDAERFINEGRAFVERELLAVHKSKQLGRPIHTTWANLDLMSDGLAYAAAHGQRLGSPQFERYMYLFFPEGRGQHNSLEALESRVMEVMRGICDGSAVTPWRGDRWTWVSQDLGWRLLEISSETEGNPSRQLLKLTERLAASPNEAGVTSLVEAYEELHQNYDLPSPEDVFATGYALPRGYGFSASQISHGLADALPETWELLGEQDRDALIKAFIEQEVNERKPLGRRFAAWLRSRTRDHSSDLARFEAAVSHAPPADAATLTLETHGATDRWCTAPDVEVVATTQEVMAQVGINDDTQETQPYLAIRRDVTGEPALIRVPTALGKALAGMQKGGKTPGQLGLNEADMDMLTQWQLIVPEHYSLVRATLIG